MIRKNQRVGVFIDIQNLYHSAKNVYNARVNFEKLLSLIVGERRLVRAMGYVVKSDTSLGEASFFEMLENLGIELRLKDLLIYADGEKKADWDVGLSVDVVRMADMFDVVILVTGDGDFVPLVEYIQSARGRFVEVASFKRSTSSQLREACDNYFDLDGNRSLLIPIKKTSKSKKKTK